MSSATGSGDDDVEGHVTPSLPAFLRAMEGIASDLDTRTLLDQLVLSACDLVGARYGALLVFAGDGRLLHFLTHGVDERTAERIGAPPSACGLLKLGSHNGASLRLDEVSAHPRFSGFPPGHPVLSSLLVAPVKVRGTEIGSLYLSERTDGESFSAEDQAQVRALAQVAGFVVENAEAYAVSERRRRWLEMFSDLTDRLQPPITLSGALSRVATSLRIASGSVTAAVIQVPEQGPVEVVAQSGDVGSTPLLTGDLEQAVRTVVATGEMTETALDADLVGLLAPLRAHLAVPGVLLVAHRERTRPDFVEERDLLASFADHVALSLDRTQALQEREEMAVVADRDRIARELHDVVIQRLFATGLRLQSTRAAASDRPELKEKITEVVTDIDQTIRDIRGTIFSLQNRPQDSLRAEVREVVREFIPQLGFAPSVTLDGKVDQGLGPQVQPVFMAVLREALTNVAKHARAGSARIDLRVEPDRLELKVSDNGQGLPADRREVGLRHARRRAVLLGGGLEVAPDEPHGTVFTWWVPLSPDAD